MTIAADEFFFASFRENKAWYFIWIDSHEYRLDDSHEYRLIFSVNQYYYY